MVTARHAMLALVGALLAMPLWAQVQLNFEPEHETYVINEPIVAKLQVKNVTELPLVFSGDYRNAEISLQMRARSRSHTQDVEEHKLGRELVVMPGDTADLLLELSSEFEMLATGSYRFSVVVEVGSRRYRTREWQLDVVSGIEIASARHPLSGYLDVVIDYSLRYWARDGSEYLFLVARDKHAGSYYGTFLLGRIIRVFHPRIVFQDGGVVKVVHQSGADRLTVSAFEVERGQILFKGQNHFSSNGTPKP